MKTDRPECGPVRERLPELIYGEIDASTEREVRDHLEGCPGCRAQLAQLERVRAVMRSTQHLELPPGLEARVMSKARRQAPDRAREATGPVGWLTSLLRPPVLKPALGVALTVLLVAGIAWLLSERRGSVVERYLEKPPGDLLPRTEAPAVPPEPSPEPVEGEVAQQELAKPPPYPTAGLEEEGAGKAGPVTSIATKAEEPFRFADDSVLGGATGKAKGAAPPPSAKAPAPKDMPEEGLAEVTAGEDLDATLSSTKGNGLKSAPTDMAPGGYAVGLAEPEPYGFGAKVESKAPEEAPPAPTVPSTATPAPQPMPSPPPPAAAGPSYAPPAMDLEADEAMEDGEVLLADQKKAKKKGKKSLKEKYKEWKANKKADKAAKKAAKKAAEEAEKKATVPGAAAQAPSKEVVADPFDEAMKKKKKKDWAGAVTILKSLKKNPSSTTAAPARVLHQLAYCTSRTGDTDKALVYYENLFAKHTGYSGKNQAMWEAANLYLEAGDKKQSRSLLEKLVKIPAWEKKAKKKLEKVK